MEKESPELIDISRHQKNYPEVMIIQTKICYNTDKPIIDCEIKESIRIDGKWDNTKCNPFMIGIFYKKMITQIIDLSCQKEPTTLFKTAIKETLKNTPKPLYGLNWELEHHGILNTTRDKLQINDVRQIKGKGTSKEDMYGLLVQKKNYPQINDIFDFDGSQCIEKWEEYAETGEKEHLEEPRLHNFNCLIMEAAILENKEYLASLYKIDKNGWTIGLKDE